MATMYKSLITIAGQEKVVIGINHKEEKEGFVNESKTVDALHHIHLVDRSYSMTGDLRSLAENVKSTIDNMADNDFVSLVWFSGNEQCKAIIRGAKKDASLHKIVDTLASPVGLTCFSTPLKETNEIIEELGAICPNFSVTLFTDGETVTPWDRKEEEAKIFEQIDAMKDKIIALNTIGYGYYYNRDLLLEMASRSMFGTMVHSSKINEYMDIFSHNYERVRDLVFESVQVEANEGDQVLYLSSKSTKLADGVTGINLTMMDKRKNQFFIISDSNVDFRFTYNGEEFSSSSIKKKVPKTTLNNFLYAYAYENYYRGNRQVALDVLANEIGDKYLVDQQTNAFTYDEVSKYSEVLNKAVFKPKNRLTEGKAPEGYVPAPDALCVMDVLKLLAAGENFYVPSKDYKRIGVKVTDNYNLFEADKTKEVKAMFNDFVFNQKHLNLSIRYMIEGTVKINPKAAKDNDLLFSYPSRIYRNHTLIKDGNLNMDQIEVILDPETFTKIDELGADIFLGRAITAIPVDGKNTYKAVLNLANLPIINRTYLDDSGDIRNLLSTTVNTLSLEAKQKVLKGMVNDIRGANAAATKEGAYKEYTVAQIEVLRQHGLDKGLNYVGVDNTSAEKNEEDYYESRIMDLSLKGFSSLPSLNKVRTDMTGTKKLTAPVTLMANHIRDINSNMINAGLDPDKLNVANKEFLLAELKKVQVELFDERVRVNSMKLAKILTGDWFDELEVNDKGQFLFSEGDNTLIIKAGREKVYF